MSESAKETVRRIEQMLADCNVAVDNLIAENKRLVEESKKTASLQEASRFYRVCDACSTSSFEPTPDGERCGMCYVKAENKRLTEENEKLRQFATKHASKVETLRQENERLKRNLAEYMADDHVDGGPE